MEEFEIPARKRQGVNVDIAPLMDMVFILLIFFIVTSTFTRETGVEVTKPRAQTATSVSQESIMIAITREGTLHMNERQLELSSLRGILEGMLQKNPEREVVLLADESSYSGLMINVIDVCNLAGAKKVSVAAVQP
jgi:biopolymer transport protein ExbD